MRAVKEVRHLISQNPDDESCEILSRLVLSLENESNFQIADIYRLDQEKFALAMRLIGEWRIDRYYEGKAKLFDLSYQVVHEFRTI